MPAPLNFTVDASELVSATNFHTIQDAVNAATSGTTIAVAAGTYNENVVIAVSGIALVSAAGRGSTIINGSSGLGTIVIAPGVNDVTIGGAGNGFTINGFDGVPGIETAAVYLQGDHSGITIRDNEIVANGDAGLTGEWSAVLTGITIDGNTFSGQTFTGPTPGGSGFGNQFTEANVPRQLVVIGGNDQNASNVTFTNNIVSGTAGGTNSNGDPQGNTLVTIDADNSLISGNSFTGFTNRFASQLRIREGGDTVTGNDFSSALGGNVGLVTGFGPGEVPGPMANLYEYGAGDDVIVAVAGNDTIDGGGGTDTLVMSNAGAGGSFVDLLTSTAFSSATGIDSVLNVENVSGSAGADGLFGNLGDNTFFATAGADIIDGRDGSDTFDAGATAAATTVNLASGAVTGGFTATLTSVENVVTGGGADLVTGSSADNVIETGGGNDSIVASTGNDSVDAGGGSDVVTFSGDRGDYTITWDGTTATVSLNGPPSMVGAPVADTTVIVNAGTLEFADGNVLLVASGTGEFGTIQSAIDAADAGDEVLIADGSYAEDLTIVTPSIALVAAGGGVDLAGQISVSGVMGLDDVVRVEGLNIDATGKTYGITVRTSATDIPGVNHGTIEIIGGSISNARELGLFYANPSNGSTPTNPNTIGSFVIDGVAFSDNGQYYTGARGQGHVNLFGFNGNLTVTDSTFTGPASSLGDAGFRGGLVTTPGAAVNPDKAITVTGIRTGTPGVGGYVDAGALTIDNVQITGHYGSDVMSFYTIQSFAGVTIAGLDINASAPWGLVNFDSVSGPIDLSSGFTGTNTSPGAPVSTLQGLTTDDVLTGTDGYDVLFGRGGADNLSGGDGNDLFRYASAAEFAPGEQVDGGDGTDTLWFNASSAQTLTLTADVTNIESVLLTPGAVAMSVDASAVGNTLDFTGNAAANAFTGTAFADTFAAGAGNDTVSGGDGNDTIDGGADTDTAVVTGSASFAASGGSWTVTSDDGTDTLTNVEIVDDAGAGKVILVGQGGVATIQDALALAVDGDTILIGEGTYSGNFTVTQANLTIKGVGDAANIVIQGSFETDNGIAGSVTDFLETAVAYTGAAGAGITIAASGVVVENLTLDSFNTGIELGNGISNVTVTDVDITDSVVGIRKGTAAAVTNLTIEGGTISDTYHGIAFYKAVGAGRVNGLTIDGVTFDDLGEKGIYLETGDNVTIQNIVMNDVGQYGRGPAFGAAGAGEFGNGIDINLKYDDGTPYSGILITDFTFTNVGLSAGVDTVPQDFGGAISIKARNDAGSYNTNPAYYTGAVVVQNGSIIGTSTAIRAGEPGKSIAGPGISVTNVTVSGATVAELDNVTQSVATVVLTNAAELWRTASTTTGQVNISGGGGADTISGGSAGDTLSGGSGNDVLEGGAGADVLNGNDGRDTASYANSDAAVSIDLNLGTASGGQAQGDVLALIENLIGSAHADNLKGTDGTNALTGGDGNDTLMGRGGVDTLLGGDGSDVINGGSGTDLLEGGAGADALNGNGGRDTASYAGSDAAVQVDLNKGTGTGGHAAGDTLSEIESLIGSALGDDLRGTSGANALTGGGGDDNMFGREGNDSLFGGSGADTLRAGSGSDELTGGNGADYIDVGADTDYDKVFYASASEGGDTIVNFDPALDVFVFASSGFSGLAEGADLAATNQFVSNAAGAATEAFAQVVYDADDGLLYWDQDGTGGGVAVLIATLQGDPVLGAANFLIV